MKYSLLILMIFLCIPICFGRNIDETTDQTWWQIMYHDDGQIYQLNVDGGYTSGIVYYRFMFDDTQPLQIHLQGSSIVVSITMDTLRDSYRRAFNALNGIGGINYVETDDPNIRAVTITVSPQAPDTTTFALTFPPGITAEYYPELNQAELALYNQYHANGGVILFRDRLENSYARFIRFQYLRQIGVFAQNATPTDYVMAMLETLDFHEVLHIPGALHAGPNIPGSEHYDHSNDQAAGSGTLLYRNTYTPFNIINFRPSIMVSSNIPAPPPIESLNADEHYLIALSDYMGGGETTQFIPITYQNVDYAYQDQNMFFCLDEFYPGSNNNVKLSDLYGADKAQFNVLCPINPTTYVNMTNGIAYLLRSIIINGAMVLIPIYIRKANKSSAYSLI